MLMAERRAAGKNADAPPRDLFDLMGAARDPETGAAFSDEQLGDQVATMILAGHETTATALFWALYLLALDPETQEQLAAEVRGAAVNDAPDIERLKFTRAVIDETMRLYPPAFLIARAAAGADTIAGLPVRKNDIVLIAPWLLHRHEKLWRDPNAFIPARFMPGYAAARPLCLSAVRRRPAHLRRRAFRAGGGCAGAGKDHRRVPRRTARQGAGAAGRRGDDAAGSFADVPHHPTLSASTMAETGALFSVLRQTTDPQVADAIERLIDKGEDRDLNRINLLDFSARTGLDEERVISGFLHASRLGLFDLTWNVLCPGCSGVLDAHTTLKSLRHDDYNCALCAAGYEASVDEMVEVAFTVSPRVRRIAAHDPNTLPLWEYLRQIFWSSGIDIDHGRLLAPQG